MTKWTSSQLDAINARNKNILVSAAAGSGKTAVLVERVVKRILDVDGCDVDKLLVVTFTNAAAAEMKARISKALSDTIKRQPNNTNALRQLTLLPSAQICTIDSFCINLVRENFYKLGIEQDFAILDQSEATLIEQEVINDIVEELYKSESDEFKAVVELFSTTRNDDELINTVIKLNNYISAQPFPIEWLRLVSSLYSPEIDIDSSPLKEYITEEINFNLNYIYSILESEFSLLDSYDEMYDLYYDMLRSDRAVIDSFAKTLGGSWEEIRNAALNLSFVNTPRIKKGMDIPYKDHLLEKRKSYNSSTSVINKNILPLLAVSNEEIKTDNECLYPVFSSLIDLVQRFREKLLERKKEMNSFTFSDVEHFAIMLLFYLDESSSIKKTELAKSLSLSYEEILVDEYQDTNASQDMLFEMLSNGHNRFMVGDIKQSIYRFRLAMPEIFSSKKESFTLYDKNSDDVNQKIVLDKNFRSRKGICEYTNFLFSNLMSKKIGELQYSTEDYLYNASEFSATDVPSAQIKIVDLPEGEDKTEYEARCVAKMILTKIKNKEQIKDGESTRDIRFGDIAVLFRSARKTMPVYAKVFSEYGIPSVANNRLNLFENKEVAILVSFLRTIDNPALDIPLLATLTSVFYGYSASDIARARIKKRDGSLYSAITSGSDNFIQFISDLDKYRKYAASMSVEGFLMQIINETSYMSLISVLDNYEQRKLNVLKLLDIAKRFDSGDNVGLTSFIKYIDSIIKSKLNVESAELTGVNNNSVELMSVHKSKGLEFPVCILADAAHKYNKDDEKAQVLLNNTLGVGLKVNNEEKLFRYNSLQYSIIKTVNSNASMSENLRVLYVAVTRAKEQFITVASFKNAEEHILKLGGKICEKGLNPLVIRKTNCDADLILMCALMHRDCANISSKCINRIKREEGFDFSLSLDFISIGDDSEELKKTVALPDADLVNEIKEKLSFNYKRRELSQFSSKRTASSLDEKEQGFEYFAKTKPAFLSEAKLTSAEKGTAMHEFMQYCDYEGARADLEGEIKRLLENGYITELQSNSLSREKLEKLFSSDFAKRMFSSDRIYREIPVSSFVPVCELEETDYTDKVLVQGIADCVFEEGGELVLVDYKTDYVKTENELLERYKRQISFYKTALEKTLGKKVKEAMLYSFTLNKACVYK